MALPLMYLSLRPDSESRAPTSSLAVPLPVISACTFFLMYLNLLSAHGLQGKDRVHFAERESDSVKDDERYIMF